MKCLEKTGWFPSLDTEVVDRVYWILGTAKDSRGGGSGEGVCPGLWESWQAANKVQERIKRYRIAFRVGSFTFKRFA